MKNALIINAAQVQHDLRTLCYGQGREINFPSMISSNRFWVFSRDYILGKFTDDWRKYKAHVNKVAEELGYEVGTGKYIPNSGMCERFTAKGVDGLNTVLYPIIGSGVVHNKKYQKEFGIIERLGDLSAGAWDLRFTVPAGENVNGITDAGHSALNVATTDDGRNVIYEIFEMQNEQSTPLHVARKRDIVVFDNIM